MKYRYCHVEYGFMSELFTCKSCNRKYKDIYNNGLLAGWFNKLFHCADGKFYCGYCVDKLEKEDADWAVGLMA